MINRDEIYERYYEFKKYVAGNIFKELFKGVRDFQTENQHMENDTYFHALLATEMILKDTTHSLKVLAVEEFVKYIKTLKSSFLECCKAIAKEDGDINIILATESEETAKKLEKELLQLLEEVKTIAPKIDIRMCIKFGLSKEKFSEFHSYMVSDKKRIRIEEPHCMSNGEARRSLKSRVYFNSPALGSNIADSFDRTFKDKVSI